MPHVLRMAAFQVSNPVVLIILMIANDSSLHYVPAECLAGHQRAPIVWSALSLLGGDSPIDRKDTTGDP
jgi:hypothetical protein